MLQFSKIAVLLYIKLDLVYKLEWLNLKISNTYFYNPQKQIKREILCKSNF